MSERGGYAARYGEVFFSGKEEGVVDALGTQVSGDDCTAVWVREEGGGCAEVCGLGFGGVLRGCCASLASVEEWEHGEKRDWRGRITPVHGGVRCVA